MVATDGSRLIAGRYRLESQIGKGGMAAVWRAVDTNLERGVAVKLLHMRDQRQHAQRLSRFKREARIAAAVQHPNVVRIVDFGTTEHETPFMVMEMLHGESLAARLDRDPIPGVEELVQIAVSTLSGLEAAHAAGIVHRDIKPENIFLHREGDRVVPKILDFGISRLVEADGRRVSAFTTKDGVVVGTPEYMSPEQCSASATVDFRTDIYSLGVVLYEALLGLLPFAADNVADLLVAIVRSDAPSLHEQDPDLPIAVSEVVRKAMARDPRERFASAAEMRAALQAAARLRPSVSERPPPLVAPAATRTERAAEPPAPAAQAQAVAKPARRMRRWPLLATAAAAAGLVTWLAHAAPKREANAARDLHPEASAPPAQKTSAHAPAAPLPATIAVELRGLPDAARVSVDGELSHAPLTLPRDGRDRLIRVTAAGMAPWQVVHHASAGASYDVVLVPADRMRRATASQPQRSAQSVTARKRQTDEPPQVLPRLDF